MIQKAAEFALKAHSGAFRKGTKIPYIVHPIEAATIVAGMTNDEEVIAAALLHDVVEDAGVLKEELEEAFGARVMELVSEESEDKSKTWQQRKQATIDKMKDAPIEIQILTLGDKLSNIRSIASDYRRIGDLIWQRFNEKDKKKHAWYYKSIASAIGGLKDCVYYQEYINLCEEIFFEEE